RPICVDLPVDTSDPAILAGNFNNPVTSYDQADFNLDDQVDTSDLAILAGTFGIDNTAPVAAALVPEPTTLTLIGLAGLAAMSRRRP
ncbi:MAG: PEP-CTERM sorting domain-containing protein, partial [Myxococcota bacterium]